MKTRLLASAFLTCGNELLLMHRSGNRKIAPGMWSAIGGHLEPYEINEPEAACLREISEETGLSANTVKNLKMRYITVRNTGDEIRINYIFFGELEDKQPMIECEEGTLHFIEIDKVIDLPMTFSIKEVIKHWISNRDSQDIFIATICSDNAHLQWNIL